MHLDGKESYPPPIAFDSSLDRGIDQVLALAFWFGLKVQDEINVLSCSVSRNDVPTAAFCDLMSRFYSAGQDIDREEISGQNAVGMTTRVRPAQQPPAFLAAAL